MKKLFFGTITVMLLVAMMLPLSANAATLEKNKNQMLVGEEVTVTVTTDQNVEALQFDLTFDDTKYSYVSNSQESALDSTKSHLLQKNMVRVSAFDENGDKTNKVTLKFKATNTGSNVPFAIKDQKVLVDESGVETFAAGAKVSVDKIGPKAGQAGNGGGSGAPQYVDNAGQAITMLPQTGDPNAKASGKNYVAKYTKLLSGNTIALPYALSNPYPSNDGVISVDEVKADFPGENIIINNDGNSYVRTGDTIEDSAGKIYTIIVYGDLNKDGKVTTGDALILQKHVKGVQTINDEVVLEAADINNNDSVETKDAYAIQDFVLGLRTTPKTDNKIIDQYPVEIAASDITIASLNVTECERFSDIEIANISTNVSSDDISYEYEVMKAPNGVNAQDIVTIDANGSVKFSPNVAGAYQIKVIVRGNAIENRKVEKVLDAITVKENYDVTDIKLFDGTTDITNAVSLRINKSIRPTIKFYHTYSNGKQVEVTSSQAKLTGETVTLSNVSAGIAVDLCNGNNVISNQNITLPVNSINIVGQTQGNNNFTITVKNETGATTCTKTVTVDVKGEARVTSLLIDNVELTDGGTTADLPLYEYDPTPSTTNWVKKDNKTIVALGGKYYTLIEMSKKDEDQVVSKLLLEDLLSKGLVEFYEDGDPFGISFDLSVIGVRFDSATNSYVEEKTNTNEIIIGIAIADLSDPDYPDQVVQGITIKSPLYNNGVKMGVNLVADPASGHANTLNSEEQEATANDNTEKEETKLTVSKAEVTTLPIVKENELDYTNAELTLTMSDGTTKKVALTEKMVKLAEYDKDATTPQEVKAIVTYEGKEVATFKVTLTGKAEKTDDDTNTVTDSTNSSTQTIPSDETSNENSTSTDSVPVESEGTNVTIDEQSKSTSESDTPVEAE